MPPPNKRRKKSSGVEEVAFDPQARQEYLTGFHKRKLQRAKYAQDAAAKREKEERLEDRRKLRESRKAEALAHVEAVNSALRRTEKGDASSADDAASEGEDWNGFPDTTPNVNISHEDQYVDDDRHTTVTVETIDVSKEGLRPVEDESTDTEDGEEATPAEGGHSGTSKMSGPSVSDRKRVWTKEKPARPKKKKRKFRYESKADRKLTRAKERSGNKAQARARRE